MKSHFQMMAAYNRWANGRIYEACGALDAEEFCRDTGAFFRSAMGTLNHLLAADRIWMKRFTGRGEAPAQLDAILHRDYPALRIAREAEDDRICQWIDAQGEEQIAGRFTYMTVTDLRTVSQRLAPALVHLFNHQTHHRGQAHMVLTVLGRPSVQLDLIAFQRTPEGLPFA